MASIRTNKSELRELLRVAESEGRFLSEYRRQGKDWYFAHYLLGRRLRVLGAVVMRDAVSPWAIPVCNWLERRLG